MVPQPVVGRRQKLLAGLLLSAMVLSVLWQYRSADAQVTAVEGSAYAHMTSVGLFGGPANNPANLQGDPGPVPVVTLPPGGSETPIVAESGAVEAQYGPAVIYSASSERVSTQGTTGPDGSVTSSARAEGVNVPGDYFSADSVESTCTASEGDLSGSVTQSGAQLTLSTQGPIGGTGEPVNVVMPEASPAANTEYMGTIDHVGDRFRMVLNEQIIDGDTITVNAVHVFLLGETARGEVIIGQSVCGVNATGSPAPGGDTTTTVTPGGGSGQSTTTTAVGSGSSTTTTVAPSRPAPTTPAQPRLTG